MNSRLHTICQEGCCPNMGECFAKRTASFLIMGNTCTRNCAFCAVATGTPPPLDPEEPLRLADEVANMGLRFVVVTSVTRDDLPDGGAGHFAAVIDALKAMGGNIGTEVLIPDLKGDESSLGIVLTAKPDVLSHNIETVPRLYQKVRPQANYGRSLSVMEKAKGMDDAISTKSGLMLGLGEKEEEVKQVMIDLRDANCDLLTIGQYLRPSLSHYPVKEYIHPDVFGKYQEIALELGFKAVASSPFVRSSYMAESLFRKSSDYGGKLD